MSQPGDHAHRAAALLAAHPAAAALGATVAEAGPGSAALRLEVGPGLVNGHGVCHGGVLFGLADATATLAAVADHGWAEPIGATIELLSAAPLGATLTARSAQVHLRGRSAVYDTTIAAADGSVVALVRCRLRTGAPAGDGGRAPGGGG